ncbi:MAG TPA: aldehyde-activating protein, partial [Acinetobacter ursingii]|nr:aldehyde-activating protein [Acinetobacter ursingii]
TWDVIGDQAPQYPEALPATLVK